MSRTEVTRTPAVGPYAPFELTTDQYRWGFVSTTVTSGLGSCVARHPAVRTSTRATVFLHGAAGAWTTWTPLLQQASEAGIVVENPVLLDLPGWGDAAIVPGRRDVGIEEVAALAASAVERLGYTEWDLVGHSLGGFIALHLATTRPDRVRSVGMVSGTTFSVIRSVAHPFRSFTEVPGFTMLWRVMQFLAVLGPVGRWLVQAAGAIGVLRAVFAPLFRHGLHIPRSLIAATAHDLRPRAFAAAAEVTRGYDAHALWSRISCPVRAVKGDRDVFVTDEDLDELGSVVPHSIRTVISDCGHFAAVERPAETLAALGFPLPAPSPPSPVE